MLFNPLKLFLIVLVACSYSFATTTCLFSVGLAHRLKINSEHFPTKNYLQEIKNVNCGNLDIYFTSNDKESSLYNMFAGLNVFYSLASYPEKIDLHYGLFSENEIQSLFRIGPEFGLIQRIAKDDKLHIREFIGLGYSSFEKVYDYSVVLDSSVVTKENIDKDKKFTFWAGIAFQYEVMRKICVMVNSRIYYYNQKAITRDDYEYDFYFSNNLSHVEFNFGIGYSF